MNFDNDMNMNRDISTLTAQSHLELNVTNFSRSIAPLTSDRAALTPAQVAEFAFVTQHFSNITPILSKIKSLAIRANADTFSEEQRLMLDEEYREYAKQIDTEANEAILLILDLNIRTHTTAATPMRPQLHAFDDNNLILKAGAQMNNNP